MYGLDLKYKSSLLTGCLLLSMHQWDSESPDTAAGNQRQSIVPWQRASAALT